MTTAAATATATASLPRATSPASATTRRLLTAGALAAPVWAVVSLTQALTRNAFDLTRHPLSALANGSLGWIQITNFLVSGTLFIAGSVGLRRALLGTPGATWVPRLVMTAGIGMMAAGIFRMDPMDGFPAGTPSGTPDTQSWHSNLHMVSGMLSFTALAAACFVLARHHSRAGRPRTAIASRTAAAALIAGNAWALSGAPAGALTMAVGVTTAMTWISTTAFRLRTPV
ncbi:DUF998 domain-containing protein [Yinghuangia seranimata]|uniref:DUF998 domain-containing protein n=1 Tax=Yinghuangia seranimata TaxID=408067 RepID=UPI00248ACF07|nr:DUF998 domain-containing protein [Yinghuangia seranimata]MDI2125472.1 DUF998 domain-containing protein [Yinghuangia seranimata]